MPSVLFVCTGNICRSPTAHGVFQHIVDAAGYADRVKVDSAGTHDYHVGSPPDARAQAHARQRGYELGKLRARELVTADLTAFDWIVGMDESHLRHLRRMAGDAGASRATLSLLLQHAPELGVRDVPDPYYGGPEGFERALDLIEAGTGAFWRKVRATL